MKIDKNAIFDFGIIKDYICEFGITSMTSEQKELMKRLAKSLSKYLKNLKKEGLNENIGVDRENGKN